MKKLVIIIILLLSLTAQAEIYSILGLVINVEDTVTITDFNQNIWILTESEDWMVGDMCILTIKNGVILSCIYQGWIEQWIEYSYGM